MQKSASFGELLMNRHRNAVTIGPEEVEEYSEDRKKSLVDHVSADMFSETTLETTIADLNVETHTRLLSNAYALAMQLLLRRCEKKIEPQRKPEIILSDQDGYHHLFHCIVIDQNGKPFSLFPKMIEETGHSLRARLYSPSEDETGFQHALAHEFCAMIARRSAYDCLSVRSADALGNDWGWNESDADVQEKLDVLDRHLIDATSMQRKEDAAALHNKKMHLLTHHIGYSTAQEAALGPLPPLDVLFAKPSQKIMEIYMKTWLEKSELAF